MRVLLVISSLLFCLSICHGYRFLGLFPFQGKSHFIMAEQLMKGLVRKGHQVDMVSKFPLKKPYPNYTDIVTLPTAMHLVNNMSFELMQKMVTSNLMYAVATWGGNDLCEILRNPEIKELSKLKNPPYDAVIIEVYNRRTLFSLNL